MPVSVFAGAGPVPEKKTKKANAARGLFRTGERKTRPARGVLTIILKMDAVGDIRYHFPDVNGDIGKDFPDLDGGDLNAGNVDL